MVLWGIFIGAFLIGFSGAMMPGPMLGVAIDGSLKKGWTAGPLTVLGHGILELMLITAMTLGLKDFFTNQTAAGFIGLFGGVFLAWMGYGMIKSGMDKSFSLEHQGKGRIAGIRNLVLAGAVVSIANPYFIIWWATTGMEMVRQAYIRGLIGVMLFFSGHILSDLVWYTIVSTVFSKGKRLVSGAVYRRLVLLLGVFITAFSIYFIGSGWKMLRMP